MTKRGVAAAGHDGTWYTNEHRAYADLSRQDRHALRDVLTTAFPIGKSSHRLWSDFRETTAFVRRMKGAADGDPFGGIVGGAIVMSYPADQYDYLAYLAIHPAHRYRRRLFRRGGEQPHHGTQLLHYVYDVMRSRVSVARLQRYLMIEPAGDAALRFYLRAMPTNEYPLRFYAPDRVISVSYDGLAL